MDGKTEEPLVYTTKGNLPASLLRYETAWRDAPDHVIFRERHYLGDEVVRESSHVMLREGHKVAPEQASI